MGFSRWKIGAAALAKGMLWGGGMHRVERVPTIAGVAKSRERENRPRHVVECTHHSRESEVLLDGTNHEGDPL